MNDLNAILDKIAQDAKEYEQKSMEAARKNAELIEADYRRQAEAEAEAILAEAEAQAQALDQRAQSQAGIEERNRRLAARRSVMDAAFARSLELLRALPRDQLLDFYAAQAAQYVSGDAQLILSAGDKEALGAELAEKITGLCRKAGKSCTVTLSEETGNFLGGFILREGSIETNCTFEVLNMGAKEELEGQVAQVLFG